MKLIHGIFIPALVLLTGCPGDAWEPWRTKEQACNEVPRFSRFNNHRTLIMAPGETLPPLPLQGPGGFLNSPTADTKIPKTVKYFGLEGIASTRVAEPGAQSPFSASIDNQSITVGAADLNDGRRDPVEQEVTFLIKDKCADLMKDPSREVPITLRLVMDPSRRPLTEAEKAEQLRRPASGSSPALIAAAASNETTGTSGTGATSEAAPESTAPFNPHKERAEAAPAN